MNPLLLILPFGFLVLFLVESRKKAFADMLPINLFTVSGSGGAGGGSGGSTLPGPSRYWAYYKQASQEYGVPAHLLAYQAGKESSWNPNAVNPVSGAQGMFQFEPATAQQYGLSNPFDPHAATLAAAHYLSDLYQQFGSWSLALASYDWGQGNVEQYIDSGEYSRIGLSGMPAETQNYVQTITSESGYA
ncbi:MAG: transglycosylase SLT domain-containing protein [Acidiferrobacteraceae bacterium]